MFYTYILKSRTTGAYYVGSCEDIMSRLLLHNKGLVKSTKSAIPWSLVYHETFETRAAARKREMQIKSWKKRDSIDRLMKHF